MKNLASITISSLVMFSLMGCNKDNETPKAEPKKLVENIVVESQSGNDAVVSDYSATFTYDDKGRIVACKAVDNSKPVNSTYTYSEGKVEVSTSVDGAPSNVYEYILNDQGLVTKFNSPYSNSTYTYNANKELQTENQKDRLITWSWVNGNIDKCLQSDPVTGDTISNHTYKYSDKINRTNFSSFTYVNDLTWLLWSGVAGVNSKNLVSEFQNDDNLKTTVTYEFDADGDPVKITEVHGADAFKYIYTLSYIKR